MVNFETKRQIIKALAYNKTAEEIQTAMPDVTDEDINSIPQSEVEAEKQYYREMGYLP